jgi:LmbE family N-acetylglucosaminyl deacetylase
MRERELACAIAILGGEPRRDLTCLGHPDAGLHGVPAGRVTAQVAALIDRLGIKTLIAPSPLDPHCDHVAAAGLAEMLVAARPKLALLHYPIWSRWVGDGAAPVVPGSRRRTYPVDTALKARAIAAYASQQGRVIRDDASGFVMPDGFAAMFAKGPEIYDEREG